MPPRSRVPTPDEMRAIHLGSTTLEAIPMVEATSFGKPVLDPGDPEDHRKIIERAARATTRELMKGKKATPAEIRQGLDLLFQKHDFSPVEELILIAKSTQEEKVQVDICKFLTEFVVPKLKSVEVKGTVEHNHTVVIRRFGQEDTPLPKKINGLPPTEEMQQAIDAEVVDE